MSDANKPYVEADRRERAALLWDEPTLLGIEDGGSRQWRDALDLNFVSLGEVDTTDILSIAAHLVLASMSGGGERLEELREVLRGRGAIGELFEGLLGLVLEFEPKASERALQQALAIVMMLSDQDLRARLLVRLVVYAHLRGSDDFARRTALTAVDTTSEETRLGIVARRWAAQLGGEVPNFSVWATTDTPEDPLLALPWVQDDVIKAAAELAEERFQQRLAGMWDAGFHIGRTSFDELAAANLQAEWCGDIDLRARVRTLLSIEILQYRASTPEQVKWALLARAASPPTKRLVQAVSERERDLGSDQAAEMLRSARSDPVIGPDATLDIALGLWDVLDDQAVDELLDWVPHVESDRGALNRNNLMTVVLWRRPRYWLTKFDAADRPTRTAMVSALRPRDLDAVPDDGLELLQRHLQQLATGEISSRFAAALRYRTDGTPVESAEGIGPADALELLDWNREAVSQATIEAFVEQLIGAVRARSEQAETGTYAVESQDNGQLLGRLASYLGQRLDEVVGALLLTLKKAASPAAWQFGALEGLYALRQVDGLTADDIERLRGLEISPGPEILGGQISSDVLRAGKLRVIAPDVSPDDVAWLAVCGRGTDRQARLVAIVTLGNPGIEDAPAVDWTLVGGLFDPDDEVVVQAVAAISRRGLSEGSGARPIARRRLDDLASNGPASVRREVIVTAAKRPELELGEVLRRAESDPAWTVRRELEAAGRRDANSGESGDEA